LQVLNDATDRCKHLQVRLETIPDVSLLVRKKNTA